MARPKIVISVPIGAYHPLLRDCLRSLAIQEEKPAVAILDASRDERVAEAIAEYGDLAAYHRIGPDKGQSEAIIEGWSRVEGDILGWLNADDALYPGALQEVARHFQENPDTDVFYGHSVIVDDDDVVKGYHWAVEPPSDAILAGDIISQPSCFFRRSRIDDVGGLDKDLHYTMDWDLWVRLWRAGAKFSYTESVLSRVLWSSEAKTGGFNRRRREELDRIISANTNSLVRAKSRVGFALHHLFEYVAPASVSDIFRALSFRRIRTIGGLDRLGRFSGKAHIPLVHYARKNMKGLIVSLRSAGSVSIAAGNVHAEAAGNGDHEIQFDIPAGDSVQLFLENSDSAPARLLGLRWLS